MLGEKGVLGVKGYQEKRGVSGEKGRRDKSGC